VPAVAAASVIGEIVIVGGFTAAAFTVSVYA
jgi:hypothetical protein